MNKKKLSVVMAGAMLATSVAPVLAAETTVTTKEYTVGQKELLKKYLENKLEEKKYTSNSVLIKGSADKTAKKYLGEKIADELAKINAGNEYAKSVYKIKIGKEFADGTSGKTISDLVDKLTVGDKVEILEKENTTFLGQVIPAKVAPKAVTEGEKYKENDLKYANFKVENYTDDNKFIKDATCKKDGEITLILKSFDSNNSNIKIQLLEGILKYDLNLPVDKDGNLLDKAPNSNPDEIQECVGFLNDANWDGGYATSAEPVKVESIDITEEAPSEDIVTYKASELYDGTLLTEKGTELLNDIKNAVDVKNKEKSVAIDATQPAPENGITTLTVTYKSKGGIVLKKVLIKSANKEEITAVYKMLSTGTYNVGIVAGQNRYETAVNVAKESGVTNLEKDKLENVILVNGESLVDGLTAAPLATAKAYVDKNSSNKNTSAPLLLTKTDSLPKETKDYLNELTKDIKADDLKEITINLVGGKSVLSDSLVNELKGMGFSVVRYGGDDREETSIKVARALGTSADTESFVVGAFGEADAMSISAIAATDTDSTETIKVKPIIVSSVHGLTSDATEYLASQDGNATIIGGEKAITKEEEEKIKEAKENNKGGVLRIAGANRSETNAKIIAKYETTLAGKKLTLVKNGVNNKTELVDALSAANLGGPIVLADSKLTDEQLTALLNLSAKDNNSKLLQVGLGLSDSIIKSLSKTFEIININK